MKTKKLNKFSALLIIAMIATLYSCLGESSSENEEKESNTIKGIVSCYNEEAKEEYIAKITVNKNEAPSFEKIGNFKSDWHNRIPFSSQYGDYFTWRIKEGDDFKHLLINLNTLETKYLPLGVGCKEGFKTYHAGRPIMSQNGKYVTYLRQCFRLYNDVTYPLPIRYDIENDNVEEGFGITEFAFGFRDPNGDTEAISATLDYISANGRYAYGYIGAYGVDFGEIHSDYGLIYRYDFEEKKYERLDNKEIKFPIFLGVSPDEKYLMWGGSKNSKTVLYKKDLSNNSITESSPIPSSIHANLNFWNNSISLLTSYGTRYYNFITNEEVHPKMPNSPYSACLNKNRDKIMFIDKSNDINYLCQTTNISGENKIDTLCQLPKFVKYFVVMR